ncbi:MAG: hypothetical protein A2W61_08660 [Deltaproteobacteria bacterium RIFCSPLOWO2_01_44_7]|nr:MAG: hypothetical protein A2712_08360 [Deltaproteobacteria bacterium RIFCSPHIGHO2_01_FULL_43_49]OGQ14650.1 MAG: hypothetical protein A3D22_08640 [Deltaproteobacteria bacterium RIFCSPHIGHO2_02_FULL_44_53]OGQ28036.1 MAG: hypothetical protein A3D98_07350 [Deltaproteobacteria bacterium RIFCSPHIGHO2_12_FULL_44_21]OGQ31248.1 MAG: hypothetical protein A2979_07400 [Deltaproteobacteria bacterium RIFCSPLOWO2_01_FULL_45_74]OGQ41485.1 MAG: hypothetical protein A2W61_08660 [Deltaproteobacteria bacterium 
MAEVFELGRDKHFTLASAKSLLPVVRRITKEAVEQVEALKTRVEELDPEPAHRPYYEQELSKIVERWSQKILKLGCEPKGLWLVDFDSGHGYYCWHHPEEDVEFFHSYETGFSGRTPIL